MALGIRPGEGDDPLGARKQREIVHAADLIQVRRPLRGLSGLVPFRIAERLWRDPDRCGRLEPLADLLHRSTYRVQRLAGPTIPLEPRVRVDPEDVRRAL